MKSEVLSQYPWGALNAWIMLVFIAMFLGLLAYLWSPRFRAHAQHMSELPLDSDKE